MESNAFRKSMKQAKVHLSFANRFLILKDGVTCVLAATALTETILFFS